ncbi:potassium transporter TrkG [Nitrosopumilus ureiphilus]|uniref:Potassium transporter Trk n=1 Tax=Nitrosopumilus ureiphilus TaxID=1470067 RepID=A0A7D5RG52_9ARCH|nr:potassium transporter TrkG [Nitrosopumilus ureiphilus]QLH06345.1 potassium transporter Trk [Nitrosopumilus ureiphilus]
MSHANKNPISGILDRNVSQHMNSTFLKLLDLTLMTVACGVMQKNGKDEIIVVNKDDTPIGIVTDQDVLQKIGEAHANPNKTRLEDIMTFPLVGVKHDDTLSKALNIMRNNNLKKLVVTGKNGKIIGMIYHHTITSLIQQKVASTSPTNYSLRAILWNLGTVTQFAGILMLIPSLLATILNETAVATGVFLMSSLLLITGFFLNAYGDKHPLNLRGSAIMVFASFFILVLFGTIPYLYVSPYGQSSFADLFANSFFSSASSFTTAGMTLFSTPEDLPDSFTFYRSFSQFVGGLSFIYLIMTAFYPESKLMTMRGFISGKIPKLRELFATITIVFSIYAVIIAMLMFYFGERNIVDDFSIAMSVLSTGGFMPDSGILETLTLPEYFVLMGGMILGTLPFGLHYAFVRKKFMSIKLTREVSIYFAILAGSILLFTVLTDIREIDSVFTVVATSTTAGTQIIDLVDIGSAPMILLLVLMLIGGCGFSTAGGIKIFRLQQIYQFRKYFKKTKWQKIPSHDRKEIWIALILLVLFPTAPIPVAYHLSNQGYDFSNSYFESVGAITTAGLGVGIIDIDLDAFSKILVGFLMIIGRLEIILLAYIFVPKLIS